ncbi:sensor histidine kinase [Pleomorphovibrio marinus]|uniref:sensor histidine kinase n=1 Tax=Pleomorphovibrio marinus TaxID=2164132 RepID=UPI000E0BB830|nr:ATP-binding protein [Pleomorphovibrio marinus]
MKISVKYTLVYVLLGVLWIFFSDRLIGFLYSGSTYNEIVILQNIKGFAYVFATGAVLFFMLIKHDKQLKEKLLSVQELNQEIQSQHQRTEHAKKELDQLILVASHEMQVPLRMMNGFLNLLEKRLVSPDDPKSVQYMGLIKGGMSSMKQIMLGLVKYATISKNIYPKENINLKSSVEKALRLNAKMIRETKAYICIENLPDVKVVKSHMTELFYQLINNALKFRKKSIPLKVSIGFHATEVEWTIFIKDNGRGISSSHINKIFILLKKLETGKFMEGSGMGLAICKKIVEDEGGRIWVTSKENEGSIFYFTIPKL